MQSSSFGVCQKTCAALAAGNSVIVKPSEIAPITVLESALMAESAGSMTHVYFTENTHLHTIAMIPVLPGELPYSYTFTKS
jgi:hypothetical protein